MKIYKFKCKDCGATKYERNGNTYKCQYCGYTEEVYGDQAEELKPIISINTPFVETSQVSETKSTKNQDTSLKSQFIKLLICFFVGYLGIHKFMERKTFLGLLYLFTFGLFGIGYFFDCAVYTFVFIGSFIKYLGSIFTRKNR